MKVLVVGSGGREHALLLALARSPQRPTLLCAPGNAGTAPLARNVPIAADDIDGLVGLAQSEAVDLVVVGPEVPLVLGLADRLREAGIATFGPDARGARIEGSKAYANTLMDRAGVPTARSRTFEAGDAEAARGYVEAHALPVVLKADGLAAGKGVVIAESTPEALSALDDMLGGQFGEAGATVVIEDFLEGEEASVFAVTDGEAVVFLATAQDHKRIGEGDTGPNTGGMGAYAPAPAVTPETLEQVRERIVQPVLKALRDEGADYRGVLFCGLMLTDSGPQVIEFNCRFGDPETQVILPLLDSDPLDLLWRAATHTLAGAEVAISPEAAACVVLASAGYPGSYEKGKPIDGLDDASGVATVIHAGTRREGDEVVTNGGRVLGVVGRGATLVQALGAAYEGVDLMTFEGKTFRRDIGRRGLAHVVDP
ncbi:phosphoribosylamine--glycine ligase [Rubricoccus marinus]|uniref:Phosphoribosylamine--glycine ligase n=1 Tax=Rubricoccus marinus TaxID=716817 RepID=A0A259TX70_9BACT|nr:phosphoribosylamine--glycine ligase [Rubricoccus marinus]OZC02353.1 phosphoribosylamine--glycine ligase [Rubricoccus marinus]